MASQYDIQAELVVLQRIPYLGNKWITTCLSPKLGRIGFFLRGAENARRLKGQEFDLFRVLNVTCHRNNGELYYPDSVEIVSDFSSLAREYALFDAACRLAKFAVRNSMPELSCENFYQSLIVAFRRLLDGTYSPDAAITGCGVVFLFEAGALDYGRATPKEMAQQEILIRMALGGEIPSLSPEVWQKLRKWTEGLLDRNDFLFS